jgi:hypothetical protein
MESGRLRLDKQAADLNQLARNVLQTMGCLHSTGWRACCRSSRWSLRQTATHRAGAAQPAG